MPAFHLSSSLFFVDAVVSLLVASGFVFYFTIGHKMEEAR
ncbi:MAG: hypothetical protein JWO70_1564 [Betaproteobacteria bacterium]|nr:hypothetical protein [Betaproteobacteria bacterium]